MQQVIKNNFFDLIIVGGGLVGASFALDVAKRTAKLHILLLELMPKVNLEAKQQTLSPIYAIAPDNVEYLAKLGIILDDKQAGTIKTMQIYGDAGGNLRFDHHLAYKTYLAKTIVAEDVQQQLYHELTQYTHVTIRYDQLQSFEHKVDSIQLNCVNNIFHTSLLVGADGANSQVRGLMMNDSTSTSLNKILQVDYEQCGIVANFSCQFAHNNIAYQWFKPDGSILAYLPLPGDNISIVWSTAQYAELLALTTDEFSVKVAAAGNKQLGKLSLISQIAAFPLKLNLLPTTYSARVVLIGDAAHTIHPLAGQGVNLGFLDAKLLAKQITDVLPYQIGDSSILAKFANVRLLQVRKMQLGCHILQRLFASNQPVLEKTRNYGMNLLEKIPMIKKYLIKQVVIY